MALVANAVYHITSVLLLTHKPRLLKSLPGPRCYTSHIWHAQSIAGIAASNDSPEQWDPILVSSLLTIARDMTHESQQAVILERLARITATTGIKLETETESLQASWNMARYEEEFDEDEF
jgi:formate-dependent nitrite reductase cytochrome c552 subunit